MIYFIGDSNLRGSIEENQNLLEEIFNSSSIFEQAGSNEAIKATLETIEDITKYSKIYIASLLNEITIKGKLVKTRDEIINQVTKTQAEIVSHFASKHPSTEFLIVPPFLRMDPPWMPDKLRHISLSLKDHLEQLKLKNVRYLNPCQIIETDLLSDKIHLTEGGKKKLLLSLPLNEDEEMQTDWSQTPISSKTPKKTPALRLNLRSLNKRTRQTSESDEDKTSSKKGRSDLEAILNKLTSLTNDMREERAAASEKTEAIVAKLNVNIQTSANNKNRIDKLDKMVTSTNLTIAKLKEDLDAVENEAQKNIVLVRRLKSAIKIPINKAELNSVLKKIAVELLEDLGKNQDQIKFVTLAYSNIDPTKQSTRPGQVPVFKIGFKNKEDAIDFREAAAKRAKDPNDRLHKAGFSYQQSAGTRIRSSVLWIIAAKLKAEGKDAWVNSNSNKPKLQVKTGERYPRDYSYVDAVETYSDKITDEDVKDITIQAKKQFQGQCEQLFLILKD